MFVLCLYIDQPDRARAVVVWLGWSLPGIHGWVIKVKAHDILTPCGTRVARMHNGWCHEQALHCTKNAQAVAESCDAELFENFLGLMRRSGVTLKREEEP